MVGVRGWTRWWWCVGIFLRVTLAGKWWIALIGNQIVRSGYLSQLFVSNAKVVSTSFNGSDIEELPSELRRGVTLLVSNCDRFEFSAIDLTMNRWLDGIVIVGEALCLLLWPNEKVVAEEGQEHRRRYSVLIKVGSWSFSVLLDVLERWALSSLPSRHHDIMGKGWALSPDNVTSRRSDMSNALLADWVLLSSVFEDERSFRPCSLFGTRVRRSNAAVAGESFVSTMTWRGDRSWGSGIIPVVCGEMGVKRESCLVGRLDGNKEGE